MSKMSTDLTSWSISSTILASPSVVSSIVASYASVRRSELGLISNRWKIRHCCVFGGGQEIQEFIIGIDLCNDI